MVLSWRELSPRPYPVMLRIKANTLSQVVTVFDQLQPPLQRQFKQRAPMQQSDVLMPPC